MLVDGQGTPLNIEAYQILTREPQRMPIKVEHSNAW